LQPTAPCDHEGAAAESRDVPDLAVAPLFRERDVDRFLVDIHPHEHATFLHGLHPLLVALRDAFIGSA